jgi:hypothetical protein
MSTYRRRSLLACALGLLLLMLPATAQAWRAPLPVGDPIENDAPWLRPIEGSFRLEAARAADPDGGPVWAIGTFRAQVDLFPPGTPDSTCTVIGRLQAGQLGMPTEHGVFRPFALGAGAGFCSTTPEDRRWVMTGVRVRTSVLTDVPCLPRPIPEEPSIPVCDPALLRTVHDALIGPGDFRAWAPDAGGRFRPTPIEPDGSLLFVERGLRERLLVPVVSARICGPDGRPDLVETFVWGVVRGCQLTTTIVPLFWAMAQAGGPTPPGAAAQGACPTVLAGRSVGGGRTVDVCTAQVSGP